MLAQPAASALSSKPAISPELVFIRVAAPKRNVGPVFQVDVDSWLAIGRLRIRLPVAAKIALHRAGAIGGTPGSPTPPRGVAKSDARRCTRMSRGATFMRAIW